MNRTSFPMYDIPSPVFVTAVQLITVTLVHMVIVIPASPAEEPEFVTVQFRISSGNVVLTIWMQLPDPPPSITRSLIR